MPEIAISLDGSYKITFDCGKTSLEQFNEFKEGKIYDLVIKEHREKRSITQNSYLWVLVNELADKVGLGRTDMYQRLIKDYGRMDIIAIKENAVDQFVRTWINSGLGNQVEILESKLDGCKNLKVFSGSSTYDTKDMARLIDGVIYECQQQGIVTMTRDEILMLENENDRR